MALNLPIKNKQQQQLQQHRRPVLNYAQSQFKVSNLMSNLNDPMNSDIMFSTIDESRLSKKRTDDVEASIAGQIVKTILQPDDDDDGT